MKKIMLILLFLVIGCSNVFSQENYALDWLILEDDNETGESAFYSEPKILYDSITSSIYVFDNTHWAFFEMRCTKYSSEGEKLWTFIYNRAIESDLFIDAQLDSQGNVVFFGTTELNTGQAPPNNIVRSTSLLKLNPAGEVLWSFENDFDDDFLYDTRTLFVDSEDNIYLSGWRRDWPTGAQMTYLSKYSPEGVLEWQKTGFPNGIRQVYEIDGLIGYVGFTSGSAAYFSGKYTKAGEVVTSHYTLVDVTDSYLGSPGIVAHDGGYYRGSNAFGYEIQKFNHEGQVVWSYQKPAQDNITNEWVDRVRFILEDKNHSVYGIGIYSFHDDDIQVLITKIDSIGNFIWERKIDGEGGTTSPAEGYYYHDNHIYFSALYSNEDNPLDFGVFKYDLDGKLIFKTNRVPASAIGLERRLWPNGIVADEHENIYMIGTNNPTIYIDYMTVLKYKKEPVAVKSPPLVLPLTISPNPVHGEFMIHWKDSEVSQNNPPHIAIYNMMGQLVLQLNTIDANQAIQVGHLPKGSYIVELTQEKKKFRGILEKM